MAEDPKSFADKGTGAHDSDEYDAERTDLHGRRHSRITLEEDSDSSMSVGKQIELEGNNAIKLLLYFSPSLIMTVVVAALVLYTSLVVWEFCLRHPEIRDVCDIGQMLYWNSKWAWWLTAVMFILNNTFIQGLHVLTFAKYLNTMSSHGECTVVFAVISAIICFVFSLPRTFSTLAKLASASAFFTFISVLLATIFAAVEPHPANYHADPNYIDPSTGTNYGGAPKVLAVPAAGTTFVAGMNAWLNISYTFIGQITIPSFIAEMKNPRDFPKALWAVTICEVILFSLVGAIIYAYTGTQYMTAPAFGSLGNVVYKKVSFSFMIPTLIFLGVLYASVSARFVFFRLFDNTRHKGNHTILGWGSWIGILAALWVLAFIIAEVIPFFSDLLSLMSSLFDCFFGFIFWGTAYLRMRRKDFGPSFYKSRGARGWIGFVFNWILIAIGFFMLGVGTYASVDQIILDYESGSVGGVFTCEDNGI
ncbi:MAG: hypothetical protein M1834_001882 [Cirrosporium novae-zelandiae]|nr:MAG: hypothetical protein M1834_001882 [Cirrosporium novae-zelandiae]